MNRVFIDTSFFFPLVNTKDAYYAQARSLFERLTNEETEYFTSNFVLAESHALILNRIGRNSAAQFIEAIKFRSVTNIIRVTPMDESRAEEIIFKYTDKDFSYVDATSFAIMERLEITQCLTYDHHFVQYGFIPIT